MESSQRRFIQGSISKVFLEKDKENAKAQIQGEMFILFAKIYNSHIKKRPKLYLSQSAY